MKQLLIMLLILCSISVSAQDVIVKKDGSTIACRVVELTSSEITYKKWNDLNGSNYVMNRTDASAINYQNGKKVNLSEATNLYTPNNQNDGVQQYNDRALLSMDFIEGNPLKKAKKMQTIGWVGGAILVISGSALVTLYEPQSYGHTESNLGALIGGLASIGAGVGLTSFCLIKAHNIIFWHRLA